MNKLEKIRKLREDFNSYTPFSGITYHEILDDMLSIMELDAKESDEYPCCGDFENCTNACSPRADYWKENKRVELNKLALSILAESFRKDEDYKRTWVDNISAAIYDVELGFGESWKRNRAAELFIERLFGTDDRSKV